MSRFVGTSPFFITIALTAVLLTVVVLIVYPGLLTRLVMSGSDGYDWTTVELVGSSGERLSTIDARIADTPEKLYLGLSETDSLGPREGMLFVHGSSGVQVYVMRDMAFPIDIIFISADGTITAIQQAELSPDEADDADLNRYRGRGKYVLEVPMGTADKVSLSVGDRVVIPNSVGSTSFSCFFSR